MRFRFAAPFPGFWPGLTCALLLYGASNAGLTAGIEGVALDAMFRARGPRDADPRVVIVAVDDAAVVRAGEQTGAGWPLPRAYYARAVAKLKGLGAKVIAFDVLFAEPGPDSKQDAEFARQCRAAANVAHACAFQVPAQTAELASNLGAAALPARFALGLAPKTAPINVRRAVWATSPLPELTKSAPALGHVNVFPEASGTLRRAPHALFWRGRVFPSLSLASAAQFLDSKPILDAPNHRITLAGRQIPLDGEGFTGVNWIGGGQAYPKWGLNQLLDGEIPEGAIRGRVVIVGVTALGAFEHRATPFAGGVPAVGFQANALDDILSNRLLRPVPAPVSLLLTLGFPLLCAFAAARRGGNHAYPVPILMLLVAIASWACLRRDLVLPIGAPLLGGALAFASTAALGFRREWEAGARFEAASSSLARGTTLLGAALGTSTRDEAGLLEIIRATALETLGAREVWVILGDQGDERALFAAQQAQQSGRTWIFPPVKKGEASPTPTPISRGQTWLAAPLSRAPGDSNPQNDLAQRQFYGALVAFGNRSGTPFSAREAAMLETLAEGAALALENRRYSEALRGRVESANHELEGAYRLLAEQSAKLFAAVESIDAALVISNARGEVAFVNAAATAILRAATPALGQSLARALEEGELGEWARWFESLGARQNGARQNGARQNGARQNGDLDSQHGEIARERQLLSAQFTPLWSEDSGFLGAMLVVSDVSAQRELERMKTDFVGFVAHELRTPLTTILGYTSLLETMAAHFSPLETREMTETISRHCRRMNAMISDLLDISRLESGAPLPIRREDFDLAALCARLLDEQKTYLNPHPPRQICLDCPTDSLFFHGDSDRIEQVVLNLLSNAVKYSPDGGKITLSLRQNAAEIELSVSDEGLGLTASQIAQMFGKFYRTEDSKARGIKGNGLGLNLVQQIIEAHGGAISVESARDEGGIGTIFRVVLPMAA